jgi:hypothetical protein
MAVSKAMFLWLSSCVFCSSTNVSHLYIHIYVIFLFYNHNATLFGMVNFVHDFFRFSIACKYINMCAAYPESYLLNLILRVCSLYLYFNDLNLSLSLSLTLRPTVSRPVSLGIKHPSGAYEQIFIVVRQLRVCWCGALSLTRGRVCRLQLLLALASVVILKSGSRATRDHILLSQIRDFPFRLLLRLAGLRWSYFTRDPLVSSVDPRCQLKRWP